MNLNFNNYNLILNRKYFKIYINYKKLEIFLYFFFSHLNIFLA